MAGAVIWAHLEISRYRLIAQAANSYEKDGAMIEQLTLRRTMSRVQRLSRFRSQARSAGDLNRTRNSTGED